jgi:chromosome segregation ATPase
MAKLVAQFDEAKAREKELSDQYEDAEKKCNRAVSLIDKLSDEEVALA